MNKSRVAPYRYRTAYTKSYSNKFSTGTEKSSAQEAESVQGKILNQSLRYFSKLSFTKKVNLAFRKRLKATIYFVRFRYNYFLILIIFSKHFLDQNPIKILHFFNRVCCYQKYYSYTFSFTSIFLYCLLIRSKRF